MESSIGNGNGIDKDGCSIGLSPDDCNISLPVNIFSNGASCLEAISKYLKEVMGLRYCKIAGLLNRDDRTIWGACQSANEKSGDIFLPGEQCVKIPISIFKDRKLSALEALAEYLKDELNLRYCKIAAMLGKDPRTIWTVYSRAKKKRKAAQ